MAYYCFPEIKRNPGLADKETVDAFLFRDFAQNLLDQKQDEDGLPEGKKFAFCASAKGVSVYIPDDNPASHVFISGPYGLGHLHPQISSQYLNRVLDIREYPAESFDPNQETLNGSKIGDSTKGPNFYSGIIVDRSFTVKCIAAAVKEVAR